jgi:uncharacterized protein YkwD
VTYVRTLLCISLVACASLALPPSAAGSNVVDTMIRKINARRADHGRPPVRLSRSLRRSARAHAHYLIRNDLFAHSARIKVSRPFWRVGEILELHRGYRPRPSYALRLWMHSHTHRAEVLEPAFRWVGVARAAGGFQGQRVTIWVVHFGML